MWDCNQTAFDRLRLTAVVKVSNVTLSLSKGCLNIDRLRSKGNLNQKGFIKILSKI